MNHYDEFRKANKETKADGNRVFVLAVNLERGLCIAETSDGSKKNLVPIELLISDMENDMVHINDFTKLRDWKGFEDEDTVLRMKEAYYPDDYLENKEKYVVDVSSAREKDYKQKFQVEGASVRFSYNESLQRQNEIELD